MTRLLLDANLGPGAATFLRRRLGVDAESVIGRGLDHLTDAGIVALAIEERRTIVTFDLDFGELYHRRETGRFSAIILRLRDQTPARVNRALESFFLEEAASIDLETSLVVIDERRIRIDTA